MAMVGNVGESSKGSEISLDLAKFAVDEHNKKENAVVAGAVHHLTLEVIEAGKKKYYEAKVWVKRWMDFKELQEFKHSDHESSSGHAPGLKAVPADDPAVKDAADHVVESINQTCNSLTPYELLEILVAEVEEEKCNVEVHKNVEGRLLLKNMIFHLKGLTFH
ncbi:hypothetical protein MKW98_021395 [Papaver atlanticum]|uniref:Cysteine proteinase inhibitor n=1 Tax=Papaver atlanticum TaxID=357466 RepID=A0AAD4XK73_9MAGN|nr:hypothetical protein MKW98_021395 [Papaver atlanticum]